MSETSCWTVGEECCPILVCYKSLAALSWCTECFHWWKAWTASRSVQHPDIDAVRQAEIPTPFPEKYIVWMGVYDALSVDGAFLNVSSSIGTNAPSCHQRSSGSCSPTAPFLHDRVLTGICGCTVKCVHRQWFVEVILNPCRDDQNLQTTSIDIQSYFLRKGISESLDDYVL